MIGLTVRKKLDEVTPYLGRFQKQLPFALALALTRTAKGVQAVEISTLSQVFDSPTRYTLGATRVQTATKTNLEAAVFFKDESAGGKGIGADKFLAAEVTGGQRRPKRFERALQRRGLLPDGWVAVPGRATPLDTAGNVPGAYIVKILSDLQALRDVGSRGNRVTKREANARRAAGEKGVKARASRFFVIKVGQRGTPGVYEIQPGGDGVVPVFIFVSAARYTVRYRFDDIAEAEAQRLFPNEFDRALERAIKTAR